MKQDIKSMLPGEIGEYFESIGERGYRSGQVFKWLHSGVRCFSSMTNLSEELRARLDKAFYITSPEILEKQISKKDGTIKYLWGLHDGNTVESVLMEYDHGLTICVSSQVGCRMGCTFCASSIAGFARNLGPSEMLDQVMFAQIDIGKRISNVVLMGIGEPLDNFDNVMKFIALINHPEGLNLGTRHITISTCGIIENIDKLAQFDIQSSLAVSLHAPDDETRSRLMPIAKSTTIDHLLAACKRYFDATGRRVTYEYAMIDGVNDTERHAEVLAHKIKNTGSHINLIPLNDVDERPMKASLPENVKVFTNILKSNGINYTIRRKLGNDIEASCGQLRGRKIGNRE